MESPRTLDGRIGLAVVALVCVFAFVWVVSALAGGSTAEQPAGVSPTAGYVQEGGAGDEGRDCPERAGGAEGDAGSGDTTLSAAV